MKKVNQATALLSLGVVILLLVLAGCRTIRPASPKLPVTTLSAPPLPISMIDVPVSLNLKTAFDQLEAEIPRTMNSGGDIGATCRVNYRWSFERSPLGISMSGNTIKIRVKGYYSASANVRPCCGFLCPWFGVSCGNKSNFSEIESLLLKKGYSKEHVDELGKIVGTTGVITETDDAAVNKVLSPNKQKAMEARREIDIEITSTVSIDENYRIITKTALTTFTPLNRCELTFLNIDVTDKILGVARPIIEKSLAKFDAEISKYNIREKVEPMWQKLFPAVKIADYGYLNINPIEVHFGELNGTGTENVGFIVGIGAKPVFTLEDPGKIPPAPLPNLQPNAGRRGYSIYVDAHLQYPPLSRALTNELQKLGKIDLGGRKYVYLNQGEVFGVGNERLLIKVQFNGRAYGIRYKGWLYLTGKPNYNAITNELTLSDIDYDIQTRNILLKKANWLFRSSVKNAISSKAHWKIGRELSEIRSKLQAGLNQDIDPNTTLSGTVDNFDIIGILPTVPHVLIRINAAGNISVVIKP